jgi:hypothetical protein
MWWPWKKDKALLTPPPERVERELHRDVLFLSINNGEVEIHYRNGSCTRYPKQANLVVRIYSRDPCIIATVQHLFD